MSEFDLTPTQKRAHLIAQIARQRDEFAVAYRNLGKPIHYAEQGLKGLSFLRQNPWLFSVVPAAFTITSAIVGIVRAKPAEKKPAQLFKWGREEEKRAEKKVPKTLSGHVLKWGGHGWRLFKLYRKLKRFVP